MTSPYIPELLLDPPTASAIDKPRTLVLAHGAGQGMDSPFMATMARLIAERGLQVVRFDLPYMARMRAEGGRRPPDPVPRLLAAWEAVLDALSTRGLAPEDLLIGGKSLGGRMASLIAAGRPVAGLVCLGYPFHPSGRPGHTRVEHLGSIQVPTLICQGDRDPFGRPEEVSRYALTPSIKLVWIPDGDHGFKPSKRSGRTWEQNLALAADAVAGFGATLP